MWLLAGPALGTAYMQIVPSMQGVGTQIRRELEGSVSGIGKGVASKLQRVGGALTRGITKPVGIAATAVAGLVGALGFKRLVGIDTARAQFKGLGLDADKVMAQVDKGVQNTALSMAEGASLAVGILATGAVPLQDLEAQIKRVANVSAAYNVDAEHAGYLLNNVLTKQKVTWGDLSQMQQNNIPIVTQLAEHYGVAGDEIMRMAQDGKISIEDLNEVLDKNAGKAAEEYANSWEGVTKNILANLGRLGATLLGEVFPQLKDGAAEVLDWLKSEEVAEWAEETGRKIGDFFAEVGDKIRTVKDWWDELSPTVKKWAGIVGAALVVAGPILTWLGKAISLITTLTPIFKLLGVAIGAVSGPVALVVAGIAALVAGFIWAWNNIDGFAEFFIGVWDGIKDAAKTVGDWFTNDFVPGVTGAWDTIMTATEPLRDVIGGAWEDVKGAVEVVGDWFSDTFGPMFGETWDKITEATEAWGEWKKEFWDALWEDIEWIVEPALEGIENFIATTIDTIALNWETTWEAISIAFSTVWDVMTGYVETAMEVIQGVMDLFMAIISGDWEGAWEAIKGIAATIWESIVETVETLWGGLKDFISLTLGTVKDRWDEIWGSIKAKISEVWGNIVSTVTEKINTAKTTISNTMNTIKTVWSTAWTAVKTKVSEIWTGIKTGVSTGINNVMNTVRTLKDRVIGFFTGAGSWLWNSGKALIQGLTDGIKSAFSGAMEAVSGGLSSLRNLLPFSPAKEGPFSGKGWTLYSGESIIEAMADGIREKQGVLVASLAGAMRAGHDTIGTFEGGFGWSSYDNSVGGVPVVGNTFGGDPSGVVVENVTVDFGSARSVLEIAEYVENLGLDLRRRGVSVSG